MVPIMCLVAVHASPESGARMNLSICAKSQKRMLDIGLCFISLSELCRDLPSPCTYSQESERIWKGEEEIEQSIVVNSEANLTEINGTWPLRLLVSYNNTSLAALHRSGKIKAMSSFIDSIHTKFGLPLLPLLSTFPIVTVFSFAVDLVVSWYIQSVIPSVYSFDLMYPLVHTLLWEIYMLTGQYLMITIWQLKGEKQETKEKRKREN